MTSAISATFERLFFVLSNEKFALTPSADEEVEANTQGIDFAIDLMKEHKNQNLTFYNEFDYSWAFDKGNYSIALEAQYQLYILQIIADISPSHPNYNKLGNIVVRFLPTASTTAQCRLFEGFRFILLPTAFAKTLQAFVLCLLGLRDISAAAGYTKVQTNHFRGADMERALRYDGTAAFPHIDRLLEVLIYHAEFDLPNIEPMRVSDMVDVSSLKTPQDFELLSLYEMVEVFVICHELAHLLEHDMDNSSRTEAEELEADYYASSLMMIHNSRHIKHKLGVLLGPVVFFQVMRLVVLVRRLVNQIERIRSRHENADHATNSMDWEEFLKEEKELKTRLFSYDLYNKKWGVVPLSSGLFTELAQEMHVVIAGCQVQLMKKIGGEVPSWDKLLST